MNIYVGNLDFKTSDSDLEKTFGEFGSVSNVNIITDKFSGRSRGFAFVTTDNDDEARKAIEELNGTTLGSRAITVNEARERKSRY